MEPTDPTSRDRWEWRRRIRADPRAHGVYRFVVGFAGGFLVLLGLVSGPLPGPGGIPLVLAGLAVLASEFVWARRLLARARREVRSFGAWVSSQPVWLRAAGSLATGAVAVCCTWLALVLIGPPAFLPEAARSALAAFPGVPA